MCVCVCVGVGVCVCVCVTTQMTEKHKAMLKEFQQQLHEQIGSKSTKFSKELLEWRRRQLLLAK